HEAFQQPNGMVIKLLPVGAEASSNASQQVTGQVGHFHPGSNQKAAVVSDQMQVVGIGLAGRADKLIAQLELERTGVPGQASNPTGSSQNQILQMLAHRTAE